ncbi:MAG: TonB-dependent receptor [Alphaproteobacteria bacterium]|nr:TonB-dependent receptor [Alphaproteobacteria bacterium]
MSISRAHAHRAAFAVLLSGVAVAAAGGSAMAASAGIEEVIVTAEKRSENVQRIPTSISAFTADDLQVRGIATMGDLAQQVPGVNFGEVAGSPQIAARGVGFGLLTGAGEGSVAVHIDGLYLSRPASTGMLMRDLDRVEFLRGPQGTLYGRNAVGGVVNLISPPAPDVFSAGLSASYGNFDAYEVSAYAGGPLSESVRARLYVEKDDHAGYVKNIFNGKRVDGLGGYGGRFTLDADLAANATFKLRVFHRKENLSGPVYKPIDAAAMVGFPPGTYSLDPYKIAADGDYDSDREITGGSGRFDVDFGSIHLVSITGYVHFRFTENTYDGDGTALPIFTVTRPEKSNTISQEFNLLGSGESYNWIVGAYYLHQRQNTDFFTYTPGYAAFGITELDDLTKQDEGSFSLFGDATYHLTPSVSVYGGARGIWENQKIDHTDITHTTLPAPYDAIIACSPTMAGSGGQMSLDRSAVTGRAGIKYQRSEQSNLYAQYSRGYKSGGFGLSSCGNSFKPETLNAFEVGSKNVLFDGTLQLNGAAYYYDYSDLQVEKVVLTSLDVANADSSRVYGLELEALWVPDDRWQINATSSFMHARYEDFLDADPLTGGPVTQLRGNPLNRAPDWSGSLGVQYTQPLSIGALLVRGELYATTKYALRPYGEPGDFQKGYTTLGGSVTYISADEKWRIRAYVRNATDEAYLEGMLNSAGTGRLGVYAPPRLYGVELKLAY